METQEIYSVLKSGSPDQIRFLIETAPESSMKDFALSMADAQNLAHLIVALTSMIMEYCYGKDPEYGIKLAEAVHKIALEIYTEKTDHGGLEATTLSNLATQHLNALNHLGRSEEVLVAAGTYLPVYKALNEMENYPSLVVAKANALLNLNRIDECKNLLDDVDCTLNPGSQIEKDRLLNRITSLTGDMTSTNAQNNTYSDRTSILDALNATDTSVLGGNKELFNHLKNALGDENKHPSLDPDKINDYNKLLDILDRGEAILTKDSKAETELTMRKKSRQASSIFHPNSPIPPTAEQIQNSMTELMEVYNWAKANNSKDLLNDAIWGRYLCNSRLNNDSKAADALVELRTSLEAQRAGIVDPVKRGGAFSTYPELFNVLCERLQNTGRYFELLESIEASKGRAIADILTRKQNKPVPDADIYGAISNLKTLTQKHQFNYLSFYLDRYAGEAIIYMVMMCKDGETYGIDPVRLDEKLLNSALANINPARWGQPGNRGRKKPNASIIMQPLGKLIKKLFEGGILQTGDHICYTADEQLNNLPLHYLPFAGGLLIDSFSFSRIHNAAQLESLLENAFDKPDHAEVFIVPTIQDTESGNWPGKFEQSFNRPAATLSRHIETEVLKDQQVSLSTLKNRKLQQAILHFSTHGVTEMGTKNPYNGSGLVISDGQHLPDKDEIANGDFTCVLTPQKLVDSDLDLHNSHVSLMACVSGLSREGLGGDALGLDWALVNAGARSILSSHWMISAGRAAEFFDRFYQFWLGENQSKAMAFQNAIQDLHKSSSAENMHQWSAFSLSGDWR